MTIKDCYQGPTMNTTLTCDGNRVHRLADDIDYPKRARKILIMRDPMVEALFGAAAAPTKQAAKRRRQAR